MKISVIIPVYNEEKVIRSCLLSLAKQDFKDFEVILVDDGSNDSTESIIRNSIFEIRNIAILKQEHKGPGAARNLGVKKATGEILVFVDADMEFEPDFLSKLVVPIVASKSIGTFSKDEYLLNKNNVWARCWNLNSGRKADRMHRDDYPDTQPVFRAILKSKFAEAGGFETDIGYTDDWSLSRKLGTLATAALGAKYYHRNPETLSEVWTQARWFGKNEFLTGNFVRKVYNLIRYNPFLAIISGFTGIIRFQLPQYFVFKIIYDTAVFTSVFLSFFGEKKHK